MHNDLESYKIGLLWNFLSQKLKAFKIWKEWKRNSLSLCGFECFDPLCLGNIRASRASAIMNWYGLIDHYPRI